jgi:hypothetical protein
MGLDIRWPIGLMFSIVGLLMAVYGLVTGSDTELYKRSLGININLIWGSILFVIGLAFVIMAKRDAAKDAAKSK